MSTAKLIYEDNFLIITNFAYYQEDIYYNTSFNLEVRSGSFSGVAPCEYDIKEFRKFVQELLEMYNFQKQIVMLNDICYGSNVKFEADKTGHIEVSGEIFGEAMVHSLKFSFVTDQFVLKQFILELQDMING
jgi:glutamate formiminotransferase